MNEELKAEISNPKGDGEIRREPRECYVIKRLSRLRVTFLKQE